MTGGFEIKPLITKYNACFPDVEGEDWYVALVCFAKENGVISGNADGTFKGNKSVSKVEALKIMMEAFEIRIVDFDNAPHFSDVSDVDWFAPYVKNALVFGFIDTPDTEVFEPHAPMKRKDIAQLLYRMLEAVENDRVAYDENIWFDERYNFMVTNPVGWDQSNLLPIYDVTYSFQHSKGAAIIGFLALGEDDFEKSKVGFAYDTLDMQEAWSVIEEEFQQGIASEAGVLEKLSSEEFVFPHYTAILNTYTANGIADVPLQLQTRFFKYDENFYFTFYMNAEETFNNYLPQANQLMSSIQAF